MLNFKTSKAMTRYIIKFKEFGSDKVRTTSYTGRDMMPEEDIVKFFGLNRPDVTWYEISNDNNLD